MKLVVFWPYFCAAAPTAYWTFDEDYSSAVNNEQFVGTPQGGEYSSITHETSEVRVGDGALRLDSGFRSGNGTYVSIANPVIPVDPQEITVVAWYRFEDLSKDGSDAENFIFETVPNNSLSFGVSDDDGRLDPEWLFNLFGPDDLDNENGPTIIEGGWHHVALVWDRNAGIAKYYHDGKLRDVPPVADVPNLTNTNGFHIGNHRIGDGSRDWDGFIDDVAVFEEALTSPQIAALYSGEASPLSIDSVSDAGFPIESPAFSPESWTLVLIPDIQKYTQSEIFSPILTTMMEWIRDNASQRNIALALQEGDITDDNDDDGGIQWVRAKASLSLLDGVVPYVLATGNHDLGPGGNASTRDTLLNDYFSASDHALIDPARGGILGGTMVPDELQNAYYDFTSPDGYRYLILSLEWGPRQEVVDWANQIVAEERYREHRAVLLTHSYLYTGGARHDWNRFGNEQSGNPHRYDTSSLPGGVHDGEELWNELVSRHPNFKLTFNGHTARSSQGSETTGVGFLTSTGDSGSAVHQMLFNTQHIGGNGGGGWIRLLEFFPHSRVQVKTFSPFLASIGEDPWRRAPYDQFTIVLSEPLGGIENRLETPVDWMRSPWFGFYSISRFPWIYHELHGFLYLDPDASVNAIWLYDPVIATWTFTDPAIYPNLFLAEQEEWVFFFAWPDVRRAFFRYSDMQAVFYDRSR